MSSDLYNKKITIVVNNEAINDSRIIKYAETAVKYNAKVTVLARKTDNTRPYEVVNKVTYIRVYDASLNNIIKIVKTCIRKPLIFRVLPWQTNIIILFSFPIFLYWLTFNFSWLNFFLQITSSVNLVLKEFYCGIKNLFCIIVNYSTKQILFIILSFGKICKRLIPSFLLNYSFENSFVHIKKISKFAIMRFFFNIKNFFCMTLNYFNKGVLFVALLSKKICKKLIPSFLLKYLFENSFVQSKSKIISMVAIKKIFFNIKKFVKELLLNISGKIKSFCCLTIHYFNKGILFLTLPFRKFFKALTSFSFITDFSKKFFDKSNKAPKNRNSQSLLNKYFSSFITYNKAKSYELLKYYSNLFGFIFCYFNFFETLLGIDSDIIHGHDLDTLMVCASVAKLKKTPSIYDAHELETDRNDQKFFLQKLFSYFNEKKFLKISDQVITVSQGIADCLEKKYKLPKVHVIYNSPKGKISSNIDDIRTRLLLPKQVPLFVYVGLITIDRCLDELIRVLKILPNINLAMVGPANIEVRAGLLSLASSLKVNDRLHILEPVPNDQVVHFVKSATAGLIVAPPICKSYKYSMPNKLFELSLAGVPLIVSNQEAMAHYVLYNEIGLVLSNNAPECIAETIQKFLKFDRKYFNNVDKCKKLSSIYSWEAQENLIYDIYRTMLVS
ncbi:MAG: glycosyl transferase group 1 [Francisellaceae bacterium]|nr:glycosyl transferase group 1 [Francisellaceae bacterium]